MDQSADAWRLTVELLEAAAAKLEAGADPAVVALAHVGTAVLLFDRFDPPTAERLAAAIESRSPH